LPNLSPSPLPPFRGSARYCTATARILLQLQPLARPAPLRWAITRPLPKRIRSAFTLRDCTNIRATSEKMHSFHCAQTIRTHSYFVSLHSRRQMPLGKKRIHAAGRGASCLPRVLFFSSLFLRLSPSLLTTAQFCYTAAADASGQFPPSKRARPHCPQRTLLSAPNTAGAPPSSTLR